ncbi:helix-turn-helix domain-containing protein [Puia sp.]|uniref:helix-turn-helix domain-containing protein n=1 Tax=Puia sp. TaxID=2045100 RepID=UPI002F3EA335
MIKIGFQPGALYRLLGTSLTEMLVYKDYDGEAIFGSKVLLTIDAFANAGNFEEMKGIADDFMFSLLSRIRSTTAIDQVIPEILRSGGMVKIETLVQNAHLSNRQFERAFKERMGVSAKFYSRVVRFTKAWLLKESNPRITWTGVAHECHYFDQMHLIRDFKEFAGTNPKEISDAFERQPFLAVKGIFY